MDPLGMRTAKKNGVELSVEQLTSVLIAEAGPLTTVPSRKEYVCMYICRYTYTYIYVYMYMRTHTCTCRFPFGVWNNPKPMQLQNDNQPWPIHPDPQTHLCWTVLSQLPWPGIHQEVYKRLCPEIARRI